MNFKTLSLLHKIAKKIVRSAKDFERLGKKLGAKNAGEKYLKAVFKKSKKKYRLGEVDISLEWGWAGGKHSITVELDVRTASYEDKLELTHWIVNTTYPHQQFFSVRRKYTQEKGK